MHVVTAVKRRLMERLAEDYRRRTLRSAVLAAYADFARRRPEWEASLFDQHFVLTRVLPLLEQTAAQGQTLPAGVVASAWAEQAGVTPELHRRWRGKAFAAAALYLELVADGLEFGYHRRLRLLGVNLPTSG